MATGGRTGSVGSTKSGTHSARPARKRRTNLHPTPWMIIAIIIVISTSFFDGSFVDGSFKREPTRRSAFMELARFKHCGIGRMPIAETTTTTRLACGMRCLENAECRSYEYNLVNETCNLHNVSALLNLETKFGFTYADGVNPHVGVQHPCAVNPCNEGNLCIEECVPNGFTCECPEGLMGTYCDALAPVNGGFTSWGNWGDCSDSCRQSHYRNCTDPRVVANGRDCVGPNTESRDCGEPCTVYPHINCLTNTAFINTYGRDVVLDFANMTLDMCIDRCRDLGYKFSGISGSVCGCVRNMMTTHVDDYSASWDCDTTCPGDSTQTCGGTGYASVYATGANYRGCFSGMPRNYAIVIEPAALTTMQAPTTESEETTLGEGTTKRDETTMAEVTTLAEATTLGEENTPTSGEETTESGTVPEGTADTATDGESTLGRFETTAAPTTTGEPTTTEAATTPYVTTVVPYPGLTVNECVDECDNLGYMYAGLLNGTHCVCHNALSDLELEYDDAASCDIECKGGNDNGGGVMCGGTGFMSVFQTELYGTLTWTDWYNADNPYSDGADSETPAAFRAAQPWVCDNPVDIQCRTALGLPYDTTDDVLALPCTLAGGINCTKADQTIFFNITINVTNYDVYDYNVTTEIEKYGCAVYGIGANGSLVYLEPYTPRPTMPASTPFTDATATGAYTTGGFTASPTGAEVTFGAMTTESAPLYLNTTVQCGNATVELLETHTANDSFLVLSWKLDPQENSCEDYKIRLKCPKEKDKYIGCFQADDVSELQTVPLGLSHSTCSDYCREAGYRYMGLRSELGECACGNSMANQETYFSQCINKCGANDEPCGGLGTQSVYFTGCELPFNVNKTMMSGTLMHNNDDSDDYGTWYYHMDDVVNLYVGNFTNTGLQLDFQLEIDLGSQKTVEMIGTKGFYITGVESWAGVTSFNVGYRLDYGDDLELVTEPGSMEPTEFTVTSFSTMTEHFFGGTRFVTARFFYIFVQSYTDFPALKIEFYGCAD